MAQRYMYVTQFGKASNNYGNVNCFELIPNMWPGLGKSKNIPQIWDFAIFSIYNVKYASIYNFTISELQHFVMQPLILGGKLACAHNTQNRDIMQGFCRSSDTKCGSNSILRHVKACPDF